MKHFFCFFLLLINISAYAQKKPFDHTVYDNWQSIGEKKISNNGKWIVYVINVQEGDGNLIIQSADATYKNTIPRGYDITITPDSRYAVFKIKPLYAAIREAQIKKKKTNEFPKDSLAIMELGKDSITKIANVKSYQLPQKNAEWIAWQSEKPLEDTSKKKPENLLALNIDSIKKNTAEPTPEQAKHRQNITNPPIIKADIDFADNNEGDEKTEEGTALSIYNFNTASGQVISLVNKYIWSKNGNILVIETTPNKKDSLSKATVKIFRTAENRFDTIASGGNEYKNFAIDETGRQIAFVCQKNSSAKSSQKFYTLWLWKNGQDNAILLADKNTIGMPIGWGISENATLKFSKSGKRLFAATAPIQPPKDTLLIDIDLAKVDIWNYKDDYLQTMQLKNIEQELKKNYLAVIHLNNKKFVQLADKDISTVLTDADGDGNFFAGITDAENRIALQWQGYTLKDIYSINVGNGLKQIVKKDIEGDIGISPAGKYIFWYDAKAKAYFTWKNGLLKNITAKISTKFYQEDFDMPQNPAPYGVMSWTQNDTAVLIYDRFDVWKIDPSDATAAVNITQTGRNNQIRYRYIQTDLEEQYITPGQQLLFYTFNEANKNSGLAKLNFIHNAKVEQLFSGQFLTEKNVLKSADANVYVYTKETYISAPDVYINEDWNKEIKLSAINLQQSKYNWGTAELFTWKAYNGKEATGIVYKPENFDPQKKYPAICYFYEKLSDGLFQYIPPSPTPSRLNISFFVSRGYIVFAPDILYTNGYPGKSAYDYVVSGARALVKKGWVDSTNIGLQGQSWGGYQAAYIITQTKLFKAAWAGAPVANMTSAYGGIRWESGMNRQFQYEKTQSRIGATLWEKPQLYMQNSPLFYLPKVTTPLVIMANDNDGAVPWYQGIELFTGLRRLNKPVWLLNYNGEAHNLMQRKNRKDIQIREQQFFDWLLKNEKPTQWLTNGVPAIMKGKTWGY
jgi:dipeptidyl aminopeptidase/acylaminoacyl peptidase